MCVACAVDRRSAIPTMWANSIGGYVPRRRLLSYPAPVDSGYWYRPRHAAPSLLIRAARRLSLALAFGQSPGYSRRPDSFVQVQWPRLTVVGIEASPVRRAA